MQEKKKEKEKKEKVDKELENEQSNDETRTKSHGEILRQQIIEGCETYDRNNRSILLSSFTAGLEIGFSFLLICIVHSFFSGRVSDEVIYKLISFVYPVGFILVVLGQSILFTEQTSLLALPVLNGKRSLKSLFGIWGIVISGNFMGGILMAFVLIWVGPRLEIFELESVSKIGEHVVNYSLPTILASSILAGWLMGLLSWLVTSSKETIGDISIIYLITAVIGFAGLHHSIVGHIEIFAGMITSPNIDLLVYLKTVSVSLVGNALGATVFVALLKYRAFIFNINQP